MSGLRAVVFDMDGVLVASEEVWHEVRRGYIAAHGGRWTERDQRAVMGDSSRQWATYIRETFGVCKDVDDIIAEVSELLRRSYERELPLLPGAVACVRRLRAAGLLLGVASSSPAPVIDYVLGRAGLASSLDVSLSSDEVGRGKPDPAVYLEACRRLGASPREAAAVEDSSNGLRAAVAAGLLVVGVPNVAFPPAADALDGVAAVVAGLDELDPAFLQRLAATRG